MPPPKKVFLFGSCKEYETWRNSEGYTDPAKIQGSVRATKITASVFSEA